MEVYKIKVGYEDLARTINNSLPITGSSYVVTATTLYFPFQLTQNLQDIGLYTDAENETPEIFSVPGNWNLSNNGTAQKPCLVLNNCSVTFTTTPVTFFGANNASLSASISNCSFTPQASNIQWTGPNNFTSNSLTAGVNNLAAGTYILKITDDNCDFTYASYVIQQPAALSFNLTTTASQTNATAGCNGSASVTAQGGAPPYTYLWYSGSVNNVIATNVTGLTTLCAGTYNVQITDSTGTIVSGYFIITEPTPVSGSVITKTNITCFGNSDGSMTISATGGVISSGYTYVLSGPITTTSASTGSVTFTNLVSGNYTCTIYDSVGNTFVLTPITLTQPTQVTASITSTNILKSSSPLIYDIGCYNSTNGNITFNPIGGTTPYNITVNGVLNNATYFNTFTNVTNATISGLEAGTYTATIVDSFNCTTTRSITLKQRPRLNIAVLTPPVTSYNGYSLPCFGATTGITFQTTYTTNSTTLPLVPQQIKYYVNGVLNTTTVGTGAVINQTITLGAGVNTITAVNTVDNCSATTVVTLTQPPVGLSISYGIINAEDASVGCGACGGINDCRQAVIDINGGVAPYLVTWNGSNQTGIPVNTSGSPSITSQPTCAGFIINVTVVDSNGCAVGPILINLV